MKGILKLVLETEDVLPGYKMAVAECKVALQGLDVTMELIALVP
jgi:hypothetical protein